MAELSRRAELLLLLAFAYALRLFAALRFPSAHHPDEIFQFLEPAHRLAFGYGILPWEFEEQARSWVVPYLLAACFRLAGLLSDDPGFLAGFARGALSLVSLIPVYSAFRLGSMAGRQQARLGAWAAACWFELVYFGAKPLAEVLGGHFLLSALCLIPVAGARRARLAAVGAFLATALMLRIQLLPAVGLAAAWLLFQRRLSFLLGLLPVVAVFGLADLLTLGKPFLSYYHYLRLNWLEDRASNYGVDPWYWYIYVENRIWGGIGALLLLLAWLARRLAWPLLAAALTLLVAHSLIPHKEFRFLHPAFAMLVIAAGFGSARLLERLGPGTSTRERRLLLLLFASLWALSSFSLAIGPAFRGNWFRLADHARAGRALYHIPELCGVLSHENWARLPYLWLHRKVPIYLPAAISDRERSAFSEFNAVITRPEKLREFGERFRLLNCFQGEGAKDELCLLLREGRCVEDPARVPLGLQKALGREERKTP